MYHSLLLYTFVEAHFRQWFETNFQGNLRFASHLFKRQKRSLLQHRQFFLRVCQRFLLQNDLASLAAKPGSRYHSRPFSFIRIKPHRLLQSRAFFVFWMLRVGIWPRVVYRPSSQLHRSSQRSFVGEINKVPPSPAV